MTADLMVVVMVDQMVEMLVEMMADCSVALLDVHLAVSSAVLSVELLAIPSAAQKVV